MASADLIFEYPPASNGDLIFGGAPVPEGAYEVTVNATLPSLVIAVVIGDPREVEVDALLPSLSLAVEVSYDIAVERPVVGSVATDWQKAGQAKSGSEVRAQGVQHLPYGRQTTWQTAKPVDASTTVRKPKTFKSLKTSNTPANQDGAQMSAQTKSAHHVMLRDKRVTQVSRFQDGIDRRAEVATSYQDRYRDRRPSLKSAMQTAQALRKMVAGSFGVGVSVRVARLARHQDAMRPPAGIETAVVPPTPTPCYTPSPHVLFSQIPGGSNLLFICNNHVLPGGETVIVPVRRVYMVINDVYLRRVAGNVYLPNYSMSLSIDVDSWTWGFNASLPAEMLGNLQPDVDGEPVELEASINGNAYRILAENISRDRTFANARISVSGRGKGALLASPYSPVLTFANTIDRTAQQLMADVLQVNGIPLDWDIDWQLDDWLVPANVFNVQGSYMDGLNAITGAAGAYLQQHPVSQQFSALLRYPVAPWEWGDVTPDFELPSDVTERESIEWRNRPNYNRVYVSGTSQGVLCRVSREGSAGDLAAPMIVDPLITAAAAGRQRGLSVLANTGRQAMIGLRLPVLPETGIITPGKFVRYVDNGLSRIGLVRGVSVDSRHPATWQSLQLETHE